ncbi:MAG: FtsX-like permease family protein [Candidatus Berkelbacteria bacterium]|nr:FtsX-like permease family protein [Candidatus Berkelbacteria bacterium]
MKFILLLKLVLRNMLSRKLRFAFTLLASAIAVGSIIFLFSLGYGLESISTEQLVKSDALSQIEATSSKPTDTKLSDEMISQIKSIGEVDSVASSTSLAGKITIQDKTLDNPFYAVSNNYFNMSSLEISAGQFPTQQDRNYILISDKAALAFGIKSQDIVGKELQYELIVPPVLGGTPLDTKLSNGEKDFTGTVIGTISDSSSAYAYVQDADAVSAGAQSRSILKIKSKNKNDIPVLRKKVEDLGLKTSYVGDTLEQMNKFFNYFRMILAALGAIGVIIAILGMFNTLTVSLMERVREVSLLKILGSDDKTIFWMFALESLIFGFLGFVSGIILFLISKSIIMGLFSRLAERLNNEMVNIFNTPTTLIVIAFISTLALAFLTGLFPARRALRVNPLDVQKFE